MRRITLGIAAICMLAALCFLPDMSAGAPPASKEKVLHSFKGAPDGAGPVSDLTVDAAGNLYGTTSQGGITGPDCSRSTCGTVFELEHTSHGWSEKVLYRFKGGKDGGNPQAGVIFDTAGNLYGTTALGYGEGTVFKLTADSQGGWKETVIHSFASADGSGGYPRTNLVFDSQGNIYGTTSAGGKGTCNADQGCADVFKLSPETDGSWKHTILHSFRDPPDGGVPASGLVFDSSGNIYGLTRLGGNGTCRPTDYNDFIEACGAFFKLTPSPGGGWTETVLYNFARGAGRGIYPSGGPLFVDANHLVGVSQAGGDGKGVVFELRQSEEKGWQQNVLHIFSSQPDDGAVPIGRLVADSDGSLFGTASGGRYSGGVVFKLAHSKQGWSETILHNFRGRNDGTNPAAGLVFDSEGHLYGTTRNGGNIDESRCSLGDYPGCGTVFEVVP
jgi:hypothetical protein